ncbi:unnamed protein product, partial [Effrenium voratum]
KTERADQDMIAPRPGRAEPHPEEELRDVKAQPSGVMRQKDWLVQLVCSKIGCVDLCSLAYFK